MLHLGYRSFNFTTYRDLMWRGAWTSLLLASPCSIAETPAPVDLEDQT